MTCDDLSGARTARTRESSVEFTVVNNGDPIMVRHGLLVPERVRQANLRGVVNRRVMRLVLPEAVAERLGLKSAGDATVRYADGRTATRRMAGEVRVRLLGREGVFTAILEPNRHTALLGRIVLDDLDLVVDRTMQTLRPRDPDRIVSEIE